MIPREGLDPLLVLLRAHLERLFGDGINPVHVPEEVDDMLLAGQQRQVPLDDDPIETVVDKGEQAPK
jgi:hypothetical protein